MGTLVTPILLADIFFLNYRRRFFMLLLNKVKIYVLLLFVMLSAVTLVRVQTYAAGHPPTSEVNTTGLAVTNDTVTVGQLHSITGTMAISETGSVEAERLAISQINAIGGVLGRKIEIIQEDGASDWPTFAEKSKKLIIKDK